MVRIPNVKPNTIEIPSAPISKPTCTFDQFAQINNTYKNSRDKVP